MKIAIYQIAIERDENSLAFQSLNHTYRSVMVESLQSFTTAFLLEKRLRKHWRISSMFSTWSTLPVTKGGRSRSPM